MVSWFLLSQILTLKLRLFYKADLFVALETNALWIEYSLILLSMKSVIEGAKMYLNDTALH